MEKGNFKLPCKGPQQLLCSRLAFWAKVGAPKGLLQAIQSGVRLPFCYQPQPCHRPNQEWSPEQLRYWNDILLPKLLKAGAVAPIDRKNAVCIRSTYLLPKKQPGEYRQIVDLRPVNKFCAVPACKYESLSILPDLTRFGDVSFSADL